MSRRLICPMGGARFGSGLATLERSPKGLLVFMPTGPWVVTFFAGSMPWIGGRSGLGAWNGPVSRMDLALGSFHDGFGRL